MKKRSASVKRKTLETDIRLNLTLDGQGSADVHTGMGFFDHMLSAFAKHAGVNLSLRCKGDLNVDFHHSIEDVGLCLGQALHTALGDKRGIRRFGFFLLPMDEALAQVVIDLSGRPYFVFKGRLPTAKPGGFPPEMAEDFFKAISDAGKFNLHMALLYGRNSHHCIEALFKCFSRALAVAVSKGKDRRSLPSTKGLL